MKNQVTNVKQFLEHIQEGAPVAVTITDDLKVHPDFRGLVIKGWYMGLSPEPKVHAALRDDENGWHWIAHVVDARNDNLVYDVHLAIITDIDVAPEKVQKEREL
jgi:hypothetical protein